MDKNVDPASEIYEVAQQDMKVELERMREGIEAAKEESFALGVLKKIQYDNAHNEFLEHAVLSNIKQAKEYKKGGMTWKQFCEALGKSVRTVDAALADISPLVENFSASFADLSGIKFSKIRYLGRSVSADSAEITKNGIKVNDDDVIPLHPDHKDEIEAYIDSLKAAEAEARENAKEDLKAKERVIKSLHQTISKQEKDLARYGQAAAPGELSAAEKDQIKILRDMRGQFEVFAGAMDLSVNPYLYDAPEKVRAEYFSNIIHARQIIEGLWEYAGGELGFPALPGSGSDDWQPPEIMPEDE